MKKKLLLSLISTAMILGSAATVFAAAKGVETEDEGLKVTVETDKEEYGADDEIKLSIGIENTSDSDKRNVSYTVKLPDGLKVKPGNHLTETILTFESGAKADYEVVLVKKDKVGTNDDDNEIAKKRDVSLTAIMIGAVAIVVGIALVIVGVVALVKGKKKNNTATMIIIGLGIAGMAAIASGKNVEAAKAKATLTKNITVAGKKMDIEVLVEEKGVTAKEIGIHDPSVFQDPVSGNYYSYGSHIVAGSSEDLISWDFIAVSSSAYQTANKLFAHHYLEEFKEVYQWLGADVKEGIWALDVTYSEEAAKAGNDPYFMYVTVVNGSFKAAICLATSDKPEGPYEYQDMIVCSDYRKAEVQKGYTNLLDVLGVENVDEMSTSEKAYYFTADSAAYKAKLPDAIDPAPFYDSEGNLYLTYGSFTCKGGLRVLKMDAKTGLRSDDVYEYKTDGSQDPYYGKKIANSNGEGPYVLRVDSDKSSTGSYYFLFWSQGNLRATGGYNMRMFRSEYPDKGYVDYAGQSALADIGGTNLGVRIMDGFLFSSMAYPSTANGGNSAIVTDEGKIFVHYHSKSANDAAYGKDGFIIKSNQMFLNEEGWLVTTPYKYSGETMKAVDKSEVTGDYEFIYHRLAYYKDPANITDNYVTSEIITLNEDGTISGAHTGKWTLKDNYIIVEIGDKSYKGVVLKQCDESSKRVETVVFTASGTDNRTVWGSKVYYTDAEKAGRDAGKITVEKIAEVDFKLQTNGMFGSVITWKSDNGAIIVDGGTAKVVPQGEEQTVTLTAEVKCGAETVTKEYKVTVPAEEFDIPAIISTSQIKLPETTAAGQKITWTSSDDDTLNAATGAVKIPKSGSKEITLTGTVEGSDRVVTVVVTVMPMPSSVVYEENFDDMTSVSATTEGGLWYSKNAAEAVTLESGHGGKYVKFAPGRANSRGAVCTFGAKGKVTGLYVVEFDISLKAGDNQTTEFALVSDEMSYLSNVINDGIAGGYLFKLSANAGSEEWTVNDGDTVNIKSGEWVHVTALVNGSASTVTITISNDNGELYTGTVDITGSTALKGFYIRGGRYDSVTCVDNIEVKQN